MSALTVSSLASELGESEVLVRRVVRKIVRMAKHLGADHSDEIGFFAFLMANVLMCEDQTSPLAFRRELGQRLLVLAAAE